MTNLLIIGSALTIAVGGLVAIAEGVLNERALRRSPNSSPVDQAGGLADEITEWLSNQRDHEP